MTESLTCIWAWHNKKWQKICQTNRLHFAHFSTDYMLNTRCVRQLPGTLALFTVLGPVHPCTIKPFLVSLLSWYTHVRRDTGLLSVLEVTERGGRAGNEANQISYLQRLNSKCLGTRLSHFLRQSSPPWAHNMSPRQHIRILLLDFLYNGVTCVRHRLTPSIFRLVPRPLPDFILQPWRKIRRRLWIIAMSRTGNGRLGLY